VSDVLVKYLVVFVAVLLRVAVQMYIKRRGRLSTSLWELCVWSLVHCQQTWLACCWTHSQPAWKPAGNERIVQNCFILFTDY